MRPRSKSGRNWSFGPSRKLPEPCHEETHPIGGECVSRWAIHHTPARWSHLSHPQGFRRLAVSGGSNDGIAKRAGIQSQIPPDKSWGLRLDCSLSQPDTRGHPTTPPTRTHLYIPSAFHIFSGAETPRMPSRLRRTMRAPLTNARRAVVRSVATGSSLPGRTRQFS